MIADVSGRVSESLAKIERSLQQLWSQDAHDASVRAFTLNLLAVGGRGSREAFVADVDDIASRLSARTFIITVDPKAVPWSLVGEVSAVCRVDRTTNAPAVCADRVELTFGAMTTKRARSVVMALVETRLPVVLYVGPGAHGYIVDDLVPICDRVVLDSGDVGVVRGAAIAAASNGTVEDLALLHVRDWREMVARFFDGAVPAARAIRSLEVRHARGSGPGAAAHAELLVASIGASLGWEVEAGELVDASHERVRVEVSCVDRSDVRASRLEEVRLTANLAGEEIVGRVWRDEDPSHLRWSLDRSSQRRLDRRYAVTRRSDVELVCRAAEDVASTAMTRRTIELASAWRSGP